MSISATTAILFALVTLIGLVRRVLGGSLQAHNWVQFLSIELSCVALWVATGSSWSQRSMVNLSDHMIAHVVLMFLVPIGLVYGDAGRFWWWALPLTIRRTVLRWWFLQRKWRLPRRLGHPVLAAVTLNVVMVVSHTPSMFEFMMRHPEATRWLMEPSFILSGLWFFHFLVRSPHRQLSTRLRYQVVLVVATMMEMLLLAMSMSIFTKTPWYLASALAMDNPVTAVGFDFHHQQLSAGILWICGDFWAVPLLVVIARRIAARDGSLLASLERHVAPGPSSRLVP